MDRVQDIERLAIADPGQTVFLRFIAHVSKEERAKIIEQAQRVSELRGVRIIILPETMEVAKIETRV